MSANWISKKAAVLCLLYAAFMWGILWYPLALLKQQGISELWATLIAYCVALLASLVYMRGHWGELRKAPWRLAAIGLAAGWCNVSFMVAVVQPDSAARVVLLFYLSPVWSILLGVLFLGERPSRSSIVISVFALIGAVLMLYDPFAKVTLEALKRGALSLPLNSINESTTASVGTTSAGFKITWVDWLALSSGLSFSIANVFIRGLSQHTVASKTFVSFLGVVIISALGILLLAYPTPQSNWIAISGNLMLGLFGIFFMALTVYYGVSSLPLYQSAVILLFEVLVTVVSTHVLASQYLSLLEWVGGGLIFASALLAAFALRRPEVN